MDEKRIEIGEAFSYREYKTVWWQWSNEFGEYLLHMPNNKFMGYKIRESTIPPIPLYYEAVLREVSHSSLKPVKAWTLNYIREILIIKEKNRIISLLKTLNVNLNESLNPLDNPCLILAVELCNKYFFLQKKKGFSVCNVQTSPRAAASVTKQRQS